MRILCNMSNLVIRHNNVPLKQGDVVPDYATITIRTGSGIEYVYADNKVYEITSAPITLNASYDELWNSTGAAFGFIPKNYILVNLVGAFSDTRIGVKVGSNSYRMVQISESYWTNHYYFYLPVAPFKIQTGIISTQPTSVSGAWEKDVTLNTDYDVRKYLYFPSSTNVTIIFEKV